MSVWGSELTSVPTVTKKDAPIHSEVCSVTSPQSPSRRPVWEDHQELKNENGWWLEEPGLLTRSSVKISRMQAITAKCYCFLWWIRFLEFFTSNVTLKHTEMLNFRRHTSQGQWRGAAQSTRWLRHPGLSVTICKTRTPAAPSSQNYRSRGLVPVKSSEHHLRQQPLRVKFYFILKTIFSEKKITNIS